jgi:hypothetical protein
VPDRLVDLQRQLLGAEDQGRLPSGTHRGSEQCSGLGPDPRRVCFEIEAVDELPTPGAELAASSRIGTTLGLAVADRGRHDSGSTLSDVLIDSMTFAGHEPLA